MNIYATRLYIQIFVLSCITITLKINQNYSLFELINVLMDTVLITHCI
jgi:hypothetical protein